MVLSESIAPVPCMHTARAPLSLFLVLRASTQPARFYFCVYTQVIVSALAITVTSARSGRARKYFLYTRAHTHTFAPPAPAATQGSPLLGVGWTVPESLTLRVISPRLPELKIRTWHTYGAFWHDLWYKSIILIPSTGNTLNVRVSPAFTPENRPSFESEPENRPSVEPDKLTHH